ncbi:phage portal protein, HK97 family [Sphingobium sp. AP50]|uniref:phage portal protein n=1 Tax=Sphingobium sp. AP50 TaxID=1884369 RepID=UPI0008C978FD|nr:phage portal protein [Sphingobium sp. AP50]SEI68508.1 phage portal protein, HK97 family [Sphingobium sp. AP50]
MSFFDRILGRAAGGGSLHSVAGGAPLSFGASGRPLAQAMAPDGGFVISTPDELEAALRGDAGLTGEVVTPDTALRVGAVFGCIRLIAGKVATLPIDVKRKVDERTRVDASDHAVAQLLQRKPNRWQRPAQFKRMMQAHVLLRGDGFALKSRSRGEVRELIPIHPDRVSVRQLDSLELEYRVTRKNGTQITVGQDDMFHLFGLTLNGYTGVTPLTYARETIGQSRARDRQVAATFKHGARPSGAVSMPDGKKLTDPAFDRLQRSLDDFRAGGDKDGGVLLLEEGLKWETISLSPTDMAWIDGQKLSRSEICMFFGVPPSMIGDNSGSDSNWGTGLEQKSNGFSAYTMDDHLVMWEEEIGAMIPDPKVYARFNRSAMVRTDIKTRYAAHAVGLQWGFTSPNEVRALEDMNPREDGDIFYPPPNTAGDAKTGSDDGDEGEPPKKDQNDDA